MLSKKYYKVFAALIGNADDLQDFEDKLTDFLFHDNCRFDYRKFKKAVADAQANKNLAEESI